jgi:hypothetical protein
MVQHETFGMDGTPGTSDSYITVWLMFDSRAGLEGFMRLHNDPVESAGLSRDFSKLHAAAAEHRTGQSDGFRGHGHHPGPRRGTARIQLLLT